MEKGEEVWERGEEEERYGKREEQELAVCPEGVVPLRTHKCSHLISNAGGEEKASDAP